MTLGRALGYFCREVALNLGRSWRASLVAVLTIATSLAVAGAFLLLTGNLARAAAGWRSELKATVFLRDDAKYLALPPADWTVVIVDAIHAMTRFVDRIAGSTQVSRLLYGAFNDALIQAMLRVERGPNRPSFDIPDHLARRWGVARS